MSRQTGRRAGAPDTRTEILEAARVVFGDHGYDRATIRAIAFEADVDPSLIYHYFGTKEDLFAASIDLPVPLLEEVRGAFADGGAEIGRRLAESFFAVWEIDDARASLLGILRSATGGEEKAVVAFRQFLTSVILEEISPHISEDDAQLRTLLMASHLVGVAMTRYVVRIEPIASASVDDIIDLVAPRIQSYVGTSLE